MNTYQLVFSRDAFGEAKVVEFDAEDAAEAIDPNAGFLTKAAAAVAGFEGVNKLTDVLKEKEQEPGAESSGDQNG